MPPRQPRLRPRLEPPRLLDSGNEGARARAPWAEGFRDSWNAIVPAAEQLAAAGVHAIMLMGTSLTFHQPTPLDTSRPDVLDRAADPCLLGSPDSVMVQMPEFAAAGVTQLQLPVLIQDLPPDVVARTVRLLGREVLPYVR